MNKVIAFCLCCSYSVMENGIILELVKVVDYLRTKEEKQSYQ